MIFNFLLQATILYLGILVFLFFYQRSLLYFPDTTRPNAADWGMTGNIIAKVVTEDNLELEGWYFPPRGNKPVLAYFHGNASNIASRLPKISEYINAGYGVLLAEYRGYGGNPGKPSEQGFYKDARAYIAWLETEQKILPKNIVLYGESIGTGVATQMASERTFAGLVLEAPFSAATEIARKTYFFVPVNILMRDQFRNIDKIGAINAPLLIIHGAADTIIPIDLARTLFEAAREPRDFIELPGAEHNDVYDYGAALHVLQFLSNIAGLKALEED